MDRIDNATIARVWQRVNPGEEPTNPAFLNDILYREQQVAAAYAHLLRQGSRRTKQLLNHLYSQKHATIACIKGICVLLGKKVPMPTSPQPYRGTTEAILRRCYAQQLVCIRLYEENSTHPEVGYAFRQLATQARQESQTLLQLLGAFNQ